MELDNLGSAENFTITASRDPDKDQKNRTPHRNELIGTYCPLKSTKPLKAATL